MLITVKGIVLKNVPSSDSDCILTIITPKELLTLFARDGLTYRSPYRGTLDVLVFGEYMFTKKKNNMGKLTQSSLLENHYFLRNNFDVLNSAGRMKDAVLATQWPGKPIPGLYSLLLNCLHQLRLFSDPNFLLTFFWLKIMQYDGILDCSVTCSICSIELKEDFFRYKGQLFCRKDRPVSAVHFSKNEECFLKTMIACKSFEKLDELSRFGFSLFEKVALLFESAIE